ncbi:MAG: hypothetical protein DME21_11840 [Verrucomicrobia bacterium]|nr:MAG: hypothetical protein DME21_11840 [Verrucomicrobiota bacterium]
MLTDYGCTGGQARSRLKRAQGRFWQWVRKPSATVRVVGKHEPKAPVRGDRIAAEENFLSPLRGSDCQYPQPTTDAVGYLLSLLRSWLPLFLKAHL